MSSHSAVEITEEVTERQIMSNGNVEINITNDVNVIEVNNFAVPTASADSIAFTPHGTITATTVTGALQQLADQNFTGTTTPSGANVELGDTWYDTNANIFYVYRTVDGVTDWYPLSTSEVADQTDGGAF